MFRGSYKLPFEYVTNKTTNFIECWHNYIKILSSIKTHNIEERSRSITGIKIIVLVYISMSL